MSMPPRPRNRVRSAAASWLALLLCLLPPAPAAAQESALEEARALNAQGLKLYDEGKLAEALPIVERALAAFEKALGPEHFDVAVSLGNVALLSQSLGDTARAESLWTRAVSIFEKVGGTESESFGYALYSLATIHLGRGEYARAEPLMSRAHSIFEKGLGPEHPAVVLSLYYLAGVYRELGEFNRAESRLILALAAAEKTFGPEHPDYAVVVNGFALLHLAKGEYARAETLFARALTIYEKPPGPRGVDAGQTLFSLGELYRKRGDFARAESFYERARVVLEKALGPEDVNVAAVLNGGGLLHHARGDYARAEAAFKNSLAVYQKVLGPDHPQIATTLNNLAELYRTTGDYDWAGPLYERAVAMMAKALGPEHPYNAGLLGNQAVFYYTRGDYARAEPLLARAFAIREKNLGPEHPDVALALNNLGEFYRAKGDYARAEPLYERAVAIMAKALGPEHPDIAVLLSNQAALLFDKLDFQRVEPLLTRSIAIREKAVGPEHPDVGTSVQLLADLYRTLGNLPRAVPLYARAIAIFEKALGPGHASYAQATNNLANLYYAAGNHTEAEPLLARAFAVYEKALGPEHPQSLVTLSNLAFLYAAKGDYERAESTYARALPAMEKALGPNHPVMPRIYQNLMVLHSAKGDYGRALHFFDRGLEIGERNLSLILATGSDRQKLAYLNAISTELSAAVSLGAHAPAADGRAVRLALTTVLRRKGRALDAMAEQFSSLRRRLDPQDRALLDRLTDAQAQLSALALGGAGRAPAAAVSRLEAEIEELQDAIGRRSAEFRLAVQPATIEQVRAALPEGAALAEFVAYRPYNVKGQGVGAMFGAERYAVYVLRGEGEPLWADLGEAWAIDADVARLRVALKDPASDVRAPARALDERVMRPVRKLLGGARQVFISPDGALNLVPFAALVDESGKYLVEGHALTYLTSGRDLLRLRAAAEGRQPPLVIADPLFGPKADGGFVGAPAGGGSRSVDLKQVFFARLPGTAEEARALAGVVPGVKVLTQSEATETALKQVAGPRVLHVATHGFFLPDQPPEPAGGARGLNLMTTDLAPARIENPLLRSGLALGGANSLRGGGGEDGILTALEAAGLDLWGTRLVVLSACETGVGEVKNGEGVYGLRRALVLAGSESQVISLWQVSDAATRDLMVDFYKRLMAGEGRTEALRQAQLVMLGGARAGGGGQGALLGKQGAAPVGRGHPFFWAAFIQSGDWRSVGAGP